MKVVFSGNMNYSEGKGGIVSRATYRHQGKVSII
jgi:hypothetical protein